MQRKPSKRKLLKALPSQNEAQGIHNRIQKAKPPKFTNYFDWYNFIYLCSILLPIIQQFVFYFMSHNWQILFFNFSLISKLTLFCKILLVCQNSSVTPHNFKIPYIWHFRFNKESLNKTVLFFIIFAICRQKKSPCTTKAVCGASHICFTAWLLWNNQLCFLQTVSMA